MPSIISTRARPAGERRRWPLVLLVAALLLAAIIVTASLARRRQRAIADLPPKERRDVYERTMDNFRALCTPPAAALRERCRQDADFLLLFPECDEQCRHLIWTGQGQGGTR